jgi:nicotinamidase-related amidase
MTPESTTLLVIDVQEKLIHKIHRSTDVVRNISFMIDVCRLLQVPILATEQYPKGLGPTIPELAVRLPEPRPEKMAFSCGGVPEVVERLSAPGRDCVLVVGIETHVCVMQTVLDLLAMSSCVFVAVDAVGSRFVADHDVALRRMEQSGAITCTVEMAAFEFMKVAGGDSFKSLSKLVQERMKHVSS